MCKFVLIFFCIQIVKNQIHRYQSSSPVEYEKELDPTQEVGEDNDIYSTKITLAIVLTAFFISPMTECLGPVLELNVRFYLIWKLCKRLKLHASLGTVGCNSIGIYFARACLYSNGIPFIVQPREITGNRFSGIWNNCNIGGSSTTCAKFDR